MTTALPTLSELADRPATRREFLIKSSVLGALAPLGLTACGSDKSEEKTSEATSSNAAGAPQAGPATAVRNPDSKLDTGGHANIHQATAPAKAQNVVFHQFDPILPPVASERTTRLQFTAQEVPIRISDDTVISAWTFGGDIPGPIVHVKQGDTVEFTLTNHGAIPHSMDFHAAQIDPKVAFRSVAPGQPVSFTFKARYPGVYMYHCGT